MNKTQIVGIVVIVLLLSASLAGALVSNKNKQQDMKAYHESSQGLSDEQIRDGLINHGTDHKEGQH